MNTTNSLVKNSIIFYLCYNHNKFFFRYSKLIRYYLSLYDYIGAIECCRRYGHVESKLWILLFNTAMVDDMFPPSMLEEILNEIGMYYYKEYTCIILVYTLNYINL